MTTITLKTWYCPACAYHQDYDPADDDQRARHHPGLPANRCPACDGGRNPEGVRRESDLRVQDDPAKQVSVRVIGEGELARMRVDSRKRDGDGNVIPRPLTDDELAEERRKIRASLDLCEARRA